MQTIALIEHSSYNYYLPSPLLTLQSPLTLLNAWQFSIYNTPTSRFPHTVSMLLVGYIRISLVWYQVWIPLLGYKRGETGLPLLTTVVWPFFWHCNWLYHLMGYICWQPLPLFHSVCCMPCLPGCSIYRWPCTYSHIDIPALGIARCPLFLLSLKPQN